MLRHRHVEFSGSVPTATQVPVYDLIHWKYDDSVAAPTPPPKSAAPATQYLFCVQFYILKYEFALFDNKFTKKSLTS
jgi:hypothetical protein